MEAIPVDAVWHHGQPLPLEIRVVVQESLAAMLGQAQHSVGPFDVAPQPIAAHTPLRRAIERPKIVHGKSQRDT